jgi:hypothetical protein
MQNYMTVEGQSLYDVCLNTYGSLDFLLKLLQDNGIPDINQYPHSGQIFSFDPALIVDEGVFRQLIVTNTRYATAYSKLGSVYYTVIDSGVKGPPKNNYNPPPDPNDMSYSYQKTSRYEYTAGADGETTITLTDLVNTDILQIEKEILTLKDNQWLWNKSSATLTLQNGAAMSAGETLFILWQQMITITA